VVNQSLMFPNTIAACLAVMSLLVSCSTFRGPSPFSTPADNEEEMTAAGPTITWNGERKYSRPEEPLNFDWPVDEARMTRGFLLGGRRSHWGLDLANVRGTPILAAERGVVIYTGRGFSGYGNLIVIEHNAEWASLYSHLHKIEAKEGDRVERGQRIGTMGRTGRASGVHLHFEIRHNRQPVNPLAYLPEGF
jgi:murein DD-endopeptidase MepM/ murein hydrolase activator NlpD